MTRERKQKMLLYLVLTLVIIAGAMFQHYFSAGNIDRCEMGGGVWDHDARVCNMITTDEM